MVHCRDPQIGDDVIWVTADGERFARIYDINPCGNPGDMYTLYVEIID